MSIARRYALFSSYSVFKILTANSGPAAPSPPTSSSPAPPSRSRKVTPHPKKPQLDPDPNKYFVQGTTKYCDITGASGKNNRHFFCPDCGSSLYTELDVMADKTIIKAGTLDNGETALRGRVDVEFYVKDRVGYVPAIEGAKQERTM